MDQALQAIINRLDDGGDSVKVTFEDLIVMFMILKNDELLNRFFAEENGDGEDMLTINCVEDVGGEIQNKFEDYDDSNIEAIQGIIHQTAIFSDPLVTPIWTDHEHVSWSINQDHIRRLAELDITVTITFMPMDNEHGKAEFYAQVMYEFENFFLEY